MRAGSYEVYSAVSVAERKVILEAAYELASSLTAVRDALAQAGGIDCEAGEGEEGEGEGDACEVAQPVPALQAVQPSRCVLRPFVELCEHVLAGADTLQHSAAVASHSSSLRARSHFGRARRFCCSATSTCRRSREPCGTHACDATSTIAEHHERNRIGCMCVQRQQGATYFQQLYARNYPQVEALVDAVRGGGAPLTRLRALYSAARPAYEQLEVLAPAFPEQDEAIDARPYGFPEGAALFAPTLCSPAGIGASACEHRYQHALVSWTHGAELGGVESRPFGEPAWSQPAFTWRTRPGHDVRSIMNVAFRAGLRLLSSAKRVCNHITWPRRAGEADSAFTGFHRLERALYRDNVTAASAPLLLTTATFAAWAAELEMAYEALGVRVKAVRAYTRAVDLVCRSGTEQRQAPSARCQAT